MDCVQSIRCERQRRSSTRRRQKSSCRPPGLRAPFLLPSHPRALSAKDERHTQPAPIPDPNGASLPSPTFFFLAGHSRTTRKCLVLVPQQARSLSLSHSHSLSHTRPVCLPPPPHCRHRLVSLTTLRGDDDLLRLKSCRYFPVSLHYLLFFFFFIFSTTESGQFCFPACKSPLLAFHPFICFPFVPCVVQARLGTG